MYVRGRWLLGEAKRFREVANQQVDPHRFACERDVANALQDDALATGQLGESSSARRRADQVVAAMDRQHRTRDVTAPRLHGLPARSRSAPPPQSTRPAWSRVPSRHSPRSAWSSVARESTCRRRTTRSPRSVSCQYAGSSLAQCSTGSRSMNGTREAGRSAGSPSATSQGMAVGDRERRADQDGPEHAGAVLGGQLQCPGAGLGESDDHSAWSVPVASSTARACPTWTSKS